MDEIPFWFNGQGYTNGLRTRLYLLEIAEGSTSLSPVSPLDSEIGIVSVHDNEIFYSIRYHIDKKMKFAALCRYDSVLNIQEQLIPPDIYDIFYAARVGSHILVCATDMKQYGNVQNPAFYCINDGCLQMIADPDLGVTNDVTSDARYGSCSQWCAADDQLFFIAATRQGSCLYCISGSGAIKQLTADNGQTIAGVSVCGSVAAVAAEWPDRSGEICQLEGQNDVSAFPMELKRISHCNDSYFSTHQISIPEHFNFQNNNMELDGFVLLPAGFQPGHSYPGVLQIHGGPKLAYGRVFHHEMQAMAAKGWFVFYCNPRGSDGRGSSFMDIRGSYGDGDYSDLMAFTDEILKRYPEVDPGRLAVCGGSYGGFMVNWIIGHTNRFCCAIAQRSISNWFSMFCAGDTGYRFVADQLDGTPWTQGERFWNQSPLCYADKVQTPTLFIHSDLDYRCNMLEGLQMFTALKYFGVETRLCLLRGENHELSRSGRPRQRIRRLEEMFQWLDKHFK